jgi:dynactin complex subunit
MNVTPGVNLMSPKEDQVKKTKIEEDQDVGVTLMSPPGSNGGSAKHERFFDCRHQEDHPKCKSCTDKLLRDMKKQDDREQRRWARLQEQGF